MRFLRIQNEGVADVAGFTVLGLSTSRGDAAKLGQFGSGSKFGVLALLRQNIDPIIFLGKNKLSYFTKHEKMGEKNYQRVGYRYNNKEEMLSFSLDFGILDWVSLHMSLREYISNAIDASDGDIRKVKIELCEHARAKDGHTTVYIPITPEVLEYYRNLDKHYLHLTDKQQEKLIIKNEISPCRIYRKGVFVRELKQVSYCDYNFGDEVDIDEARNMDDYNCKYKAREYFADFCPADDFVRVIANNTKIDALELTANSWQCLDSKRKEDIKKSFTKEYGNACIGTELEGNMINFAMEKGIQTVVVRSEDMRKLLTKFLPAVSSFDQNIYEGCEILPCRPDTEARCKKVWMWLEQLGLTAGKPMPTVGSFRIIMSNQVNINGFWKPGTDAIYINEMNPIATNIILEEFGHYITGALDLTRDFQSWAYLAAGAILEFHENS